MPKCKFTEVQWALGRTKTVILNHCCSRSFVKHDGLFEVLKAWQRFSTTSKIKLTWLIFPRSWLCNLSFCSIFHPFYMKNHENPCQCKSQSQQRLFREKLGKSTRGDLSRRPGRWSNSRGTLFCLKTPSCLSFDDFLKLHHNVNSHFTNSKSFQDSRLRILSHNVPTHHFH